MFRAVALTLRARLRQFRWLREIFLMTQPPLLAVMQGGEYTLSSEFYNTLELGGQLLGCSDTLNPRTR